MQSHVARAAKWMVRPATDKSDQDRLHRIAVAIAQALLHERSQTRLIDPLQPVCLFRGWLLLRYRGCAFDKGRTFELVEPDTRKLPGLAAEASV
jgi:hypothetical protein